ncbi:hypothetical protein KXW10_002952, partial [Aspergillus fumigatus]
GVEHFNAHETASLNNKSEPWQGARSSHPPKEFKEVPVTRTNASKSFPSHGILSKQLGNGSYCLLEIVLRPKTSTSDQQKKAPGRERGAKIQKHNLLLNWSDRF